MSMSAHAPPDSSKTKYEPVDSNAHHVVGTEDDNDCPAVGLLRLNALPERLVEDPPQVSYGDESVCDAFRSRVGWLGLFLIGLWSAAFIIDAFEHTLQAFSSPLQPSPSVCSLGTLSSPQRPGQVVAPHGAGLANLIFAPAVRLSHR